ncbi:hypothetical protein SLEP1_g55367 [Rubroshorea leprosula]|uniref:Uncharacterized protein n=1 Tax=Rubroshorea leprosula TaxID=152421 RepID=A0AAV5MGB7_9ROSI|nr:hypothetical protein SLEP1_g55367 [Rubroshorea leprosula]
MAAKGHCKVHYGDGNDDEEAELEEFYDYSSSYMDEDGNQLVAAGDMGDVELGSGSELIITRRSDSGIWTKTLGSREFLHYYRQKPRPSPANKMAITAALASRSFLMSPNLSFRWKLNSHSFPPSFHGLGHVMTKNFVIIFRYRSMGLATIHSKEQIVRMKVMKEMNRSGVDAMRTKLGIKDNVVRNLPKNVPY